MFFNFSSNIRYKVTILIQPFQWLALVKYDKKYDFNTSQLIKHFEYDKKNEGNSVKFIIPSKFLGHCEVVKGISEQVLQEVFAESIY